MSAMQSGTWRDYEPAVRAYLTYCKKAAAELKLKRSHLDERHHPTADGAVKLIHGDAKLIREAFREITGSAA